MLMPSLSATRASLPPAPAYAGPLALPWSLLRTGQLRHCANELQTVRRTHEDQLTVDQRALLSLLEVEVRLAGGDVSGAAAAAESLDVASTGVPALAARLGRGELAAALGDHASAVGCFLGAGELGDTGEDLLRPWRVGAALGMVRTGRRREGADLAREQVTRAEESGSPYALAHGLRALATADAGNDPLRTLHRAQELATVAGDLRLAHQLDTDVAALMLLNPFGHPAADAITLLRRAESYAAGEALWPLHQRITGLLARAGERPRPLDGEALSLLTPAEQRVAQLAANGLTNREIAEQLAVTIKGVEWHLSRVYRKLGIGSRDGLVALLVLGAPAAC